MKHYLLNKNVVVEKVEEDYILLLDNKLFQINEYGYYIIESLCNKNMFLDDFISSEINSNKDVESKIILDKINLFVNELVNKNVLLVSYEKGNNNEK